VRSASTSPSSWCSWLAGEERERPTINLVLTDAAPGAGGEAGGHLVVNPMSPERPRAARRLTLAAMSGAGRPGRAARGTPGGPGRPGQVRTGEQRQEKILLTAKKADLKQGEH